MKQTIKTKGLVLVLGASGGIGNGVAAALLDDHQVVGTYYKNSDQVVDLEGHSNLTSCYLDVTSLPSLRVLAEFVKQQSESLVGIINATGVLGFEEQKDSDVAVWNKTIATNLTANYLISQTLLPMVQKNGSFVILSSTDAHFGAVSTVAYAVSKAGVNSLTKSLALQWGPKQISVNAIAPGWVETEMMTQSGDELVEYAKEINTLGRNATNSDISHLVRYLLSPAAGYLTGQVIALDGGYTNQDMTIIREAQLQRDTLAVT